ncbi:MAG: hypothetical protein U1F66_04950 [bacterium]
MKPARGKSILYLVAALWAVMAMAAPSLLTLCRGSQVARMAAHDCCAGTNTCHAQFGRRPCCEWQGAPAGVPVVPVATGSDGVAVLSLCANISKVISLSPPAWVGLSKTLRQAQAPPLYLAKQSFLC